MRVLVTGGAGYVGSVVVDHLLSCRYEVTILDNLRGGDHGLRLDGCLVNIADVRDAYDLVEDNDAVVHLAAIVGDRACQEFYDEAISVNIGGTAKLAGLCANKKFVFFSTCSNYGITQAGILATEDTPVTPLSHYAKTKVNAEKIVLQNKGTVLRMGTVCGLSPRMRNDLFVNDVATHAAQERQFEVYNPGAWRPFTHIEDVAAAVGAALETDLRGVYNVVGENLTKREIVQQAESKYGLRAIHVNRGRDDRDYAVSGHKFREATGWEPRKTVADALEEVHAQALYDRAIQGYAVA